MLLLLMLLSTEALSYRIRSTPFTYSKLFSSSSCSGSSISNTGNGIEVYFSPGCKYCRIAKSTISDMGLDYISIDISDDDQVRRLVGNQLERYSYTKSHTIPQIYIKDSHIGGCDNLLNEVATGNIYNILRYNNITVDENISDKVTVPHHIGGNAINAVDITKALNDQDRIPPPLSNSSLLTAINLSTYLQKSALQLLDKFSSRSGLCIDYRRMASSDEFLSFMQATAILKSCPIDSLSLLSSTQRLVFFCNVYNVLIIHATCLIGAPANDPISRRDFFNGKSGAYYSIGSYGFTPDDIEHGILRANAKHPSQADTSISTYFASNDIRSSIALNEVDARIHFILNCGAKSCPPIKVLTEDSYDIALQAAAATYLDYEVTYDPIQKILSLPKLLLWYGSDFSDDLSTRLQRIVELLPPAKKALLQSMLPSNVNDFTIVYSEYNWSINQCDEGI